MAQTELLKIDYSFNIGKYKNQDEKLDKNNVLVKINALLNILHMRPGTLQDTPYCGMDMDGLLYAEGDEMYKKRSAIQTEILYQANRYIQNEFLQSVEIKAEKVKGANDGSQEITITILLNNNMVVSIESVNTPTGLVFKRAVLDSSPFISHT